MALGRIIIARDVRNSLTAAGKPMREVGFRHSWTKDRNDIDGRWGFQRSYVSRIDKATGRCPSDPVHGPHVSEHELRSVDLGKLAGHLAARNTSSLSSRSKRRVHQNVDGVQRTTGHDHQRSKGGDLHRLQDAGSGGQPSRHGRCRGGPASHVRTTRKGRQVVLSW